MSVRVKQKSNDVVVIRAGNPLEISFILNYLNNIKRMPPQMRPFKDISVKDMRGDEIRLPEPPKQPAMELKPPAAAVPLTIKPVEQDSGGSIKFFDKPAVASGQVVTVVHNQPIPACVPSGQVVNIASNPQVVIAPSADVQKIAEGIAIGKAAGAVQKIVEKKE